MTKMNSRPVLEGAQFYGGYSNAQRHLRPIFLTTITTSAGIFWKIFRKRGVSNA